MKSEKLKTSAIIIQRPTDVVFYCPCCHSSVDVPFDAVAFVTDYWWDGAYVDCPECGAEVYLDDFEVD